MAALKFSLDNPGTCGDNVPEPSAGASADKARLVRCSGGTRSNELRLVTPGTVGHGDRDTAALAGPDDCSAEAQFKVIVDDDLERMSRAERRDAVVGSRDRDQVVSGPGFWPESKSSRR